MPSGSPAGAEVARTDEGHRRVAPGDAAAAAGFVPLVPAFVPEGYALAEVAVARNPGPYAPGAEPSTRALVTVAYRRGLDLLLVTTSLADGPTRRSAEPGDGPGRAEWVVLAGGALDGSDAAVVLVPGSVPHLSATAGGLGVTVSGNLARAELLRVAESLRPLG